jgi:hypothetical protein
MPAEAEAAEVEEDPEQEGEAEEEEGANVGDTPQQPLRKYNKNKDHSIPQEPIKQIWFLCQPRHINLGKFKEPRRRHVYHAILHAGNKHAVP